LAKTINKWAHAPTIGVTIHSITGFKSRENIKRNNSKHLKNGEKHQTWWNATIPNWHPQWLARNNPHKHDVRTYSKSLQQEKQYLLKIQIYLLLCVDSGSPTTFEKSTYKNIMMCNYFWHFIQ
jgi:hypothetical protein